MNRFFIEDIYKFKIMCKKIYIELRNVMGNITLKIESWSYFSIPQKGDIINLEDFITDDDFVRYIEISLFYLFPPEREEIKSKGKYEYFSNLTFTVSRVNWKKNGDDVYPILTLELTNSEPLKQLSMFKRLYSFRDYNSSLVKDGKFCIVKFKFKGQMLFQICRIIRNDSYSFLVAFLGKNSRDSGIKSFDITDGTRGGDEDFRIILIESEE